MSGIADFFENVRGVIFPFAGQVAPSGFLMCDGSAVDRTTYAALFGVIGTTFGAGDGSTTFNVPDMRGRVAAGRDDMGGTAAGRLTAGGSGITGTTLGAAGGAETHTLIVAEMPSHSHGGASDFTGLQNAGGSAAMHPGYNTGSAGGDGAHNNTQPTLVLNHIIKD